MGCTHSWSPPPSDSFTSLRPGRAFRQFTSEKAIRHISFGCFDTKKMPNTNGNTIPAPRWTKCTESRRNASKCAMCAEKINDFNGLYRRKRGSFGKGAYGERRDGAQRRNPSQENLALFSNAWNSHSDSTNQQKYQQNISVDWFGSRILPHSTQPHIHFNSETDRRATRFWPRLDHHPMGCGDRSEGPPVRPFSRWEIPLLSSRSYSVMTSVPLDMAERDSIRFLAIERSITFHHEQIPVQKPEQERG